MLLELIVIFNYKREQFANGECRVIYMEVSFVLEGFSEVPQLRFYRTFALL